MKVSILGGAGAVGTAVAYALIARNLCNEIVIIDIDEEKAMGESLDLLHCADFAHIRNVIYGTDKDSIDSDLIIVTASIPYDRNLPDRLDYLQNNAKIMRQTIPALASYSPNAIILVISNPVDILTDLVADLSGFDKGRVLGSGTLLDSSRFKLALSEKLGLATKNINGYVIAEHGYSAFPVWSSVSIGAIALDKYLKASKKSLTDKDKEEIAKYIIKSPDDILGWKGNTNLAIGLSAATIVESIIRDQKLIFPVSTKIEDYYGVDGVYLSLPCVVGKNGVEEVIPIELSSEEIQLWKESGRIIAENTKLIK